MTTRFAVSAAPPGVSQVIAIDEVTAVGVKVRVLVRIPFELFVKVAMNPIREKFKPTGSLVKNDAEKTFGFDSHLWVPLVVQVHILCSSSPGHTTRLSHCRVTAA